MTPLAHALATPSCTTDHERYARCVDISRRVRWDIDRDVIRGREFDLRHKFLPDGLSLVNELPFLTGSERRFLSQVQGRTYANMLGLVERFITVKMLDMSREHGLGDQTALEALVRFTDEELKHQELFRRIECLAGEKMSAGYTFDLAADDLALFVLGKSTWAVLALTCHIELYTQAHYRASIGAAEGVSELFRDVFRFHWKEESQHAELDELEWLRADARLASAAERDAAVDELIALFSGMDGILQAQAGADAAYFMQVLGKDGDMGRMAQVRTTVLKAYRWQYIVSGLFEPRFQKVLGGMVTEEQGQRIRTALSPLNATRPNRATESQPQ